MSGPDCVWCGMTIDAHREQGPAAKTPCGMLKRGFKPITQTSVGDVPAPLVINTQFGKVEVVADPNMRKGDAPVFVQTKTPTLEQRIHAIISETVVDGVALGTKHERAAVVKYLRREAAQHPGSDVEPFCMSLADTIEQGGHLK